MLFTGIDFDLFNEVLQKAGEDLKALLEQKVVAGGPRGHGPQSSHIVLYQLCYMAMLHPDIIEREAADVG